MIKIDIICEKLSSKFNENGKYSFQNAITSFINCKQDDRLIKYLRSASSDYILILNKHDKLSDNFLKENLRLAIFKNDFKSIICPKNNYKLNISGKLIPTHLLRDFLMDKDVRNFDYEKLSFFNYVTNSILNSKTSYNPPKISSYKSAIRDLYDTIIMLQSLEKELIRYGIYEEQKFINVYLETIISKYEKVRLSVSLNKPSKVNTFILTSLYCIFKAKFKDSNAMDRYIEKHKKNLDVLTFNEDLKDVEEYIDENVLNNISKIENLQEKSKEKVFSKILMSYQNLL